MTLTIETFESPLVPGFLGLQWGGQSFTVYRSREAAEADAKEFTEFLWHHSENEEQPEYAQAVERADGRFLIAQVNPADNTFHWVDCRAFRPED